MNEIPQNPMTALEEGATQLHEFFCAYVNAGFTEDQAMQLLCTMMPLMMGK